MITRVLLLVLLLTAIAHADPPRRLYVRAGVAHITWMSDSREVTLSNIHGPASLALSDGPIADSGAAIDPVTVPAAIIGYVLPVLDDRLAIETVLGAPFKVSFRATGSLANMSIAPTALGIPTGVPPLGSELGEATAAPPIVTLVYRHSFGPLQPYGGAGIAGLITYNAHATNPVLTEVSQPRFDLDPAAGLALQAGFDLRLSKRIGARVDLKYIALMKAHATVSHIEVRTPGIPLFDQVDVGTATMDMWVNPLVVQIGVGVDL
jgi:outer membrane protein W